MNRLPNLPFLPAVPPGPQQAYDQKLNLAIAQGYQTLARSIDGMILTGGTSLPGASGLRRLYYNGSTLYIDTTTSWTPVAIGNASVLSISSTVLPSGAYPHNITAGAGPGNMVPIFMPMGPHLLNISSVDLLMSRGQASAVGSSQAHRLTIHGAVYGTAIGGGFAFVTSSSASLAWTVTGASFAGTAVKRAVLPWTLTLPSGPEYILGIMTSTSSSGNALAVTHSQLVAPAAMAFTFLGDLTQSLTVSTHQMVMGYGMFSASTSVWPGVVVAGDVSHTVALQFPVAVLRNQATV
jgi:hypothetical protein